MATIVGESGAWKDVLAMAHSVGINLADPADVGRELIDARRQLQLTITQAKDELAKQQTTLEQQVNQARAEQERNTDMAARQLQSDIALLQSRLVLPEGQSRLWLAQLWTRLYVWCSSALRRSNYRKYVQQLDCTVTDVEQALARFSSEKQSQIDARTARIKQTICTLQGIAGSCELPGAIAERAVINELRRLPDEYVLMNDVHLEYHKSIHFDGDYLRTAQLDHVLIGPESVYVIETKNWSSSFVASGEYFSPFQQVKRAGYLCHRVLEEAGSPCHVRSVVAYAGAEPPRPRDSRIPAIPVARLFSYVQYGERAISAAQIAQIRRTLS